jgi:uncharacterized protein (TIGR03000 family)
MFTAVLMVAMTTTEATPDFGRRGRGGGCCGCYGGGYVSACYGGYGGCYGGYGGCYGGGCYGGGCYGGGYAYGCYGGYGGGYGRGYGSGYGMMNYGYGGGYGGGYGRGYGMMNYGYGGGYYGPGTYRMPGTGDRERFNPADTGGGGNKGGDEGNNNDQYQQEVQKPAKAKIIVRLPADAKLTIDDQPTKSTRARRVFSSPALQPGRTYYYNLAATIVREGRPVITRQRVRVRPGEVTRVSFDFPKASLTRK